MARNAPVCANCGYDERKGFDSGRGVGASATRGGVLTCHKCGYDLRGLRDRKCPECGTVVSRLDSMQRLREKEERQYLLVHSTVPIIGSGIGLLLMIIVLISTGNTRPEAAWVRIPIMLYSAVGLYWVISASWLGIDAPPKIFTLRAIAACVWGLLVVCTCAWLMPTLMIVSPITIFMPILVTSAGLFLSVLVFARRELTECIALAAPITLMWYLLEFGLAVSGGGYSSGERLFRWIMST